MLKLGGRVMGRGLMSMCNDERERRSWCYWDLCCVTSDIGCRKLLEQCIECI
jgi:hypothetical protein